MLQYVAKDLSGLIPPSALNQHLDVPNFYVVHKLRLLLFPWRYRLWTQRIRRSEAGAADFQAPRADVNAPDLYIPLMAFTTYILLVALQIGLQDKFHPEILGVTGSKSGSGPVVDLLSYGVYKFVGVIVTIVAGLLTTSRMLYLLAFVYTFLANAFFLLRSLRSVVLPDAAAPGAVGTVSHAQRSRRITFLFLVAVVQVLWMGVLVRV
ncbi:unnamed protein product [Peniophora sp. CBMAI 1063]|nr:unnamed protein product [Peniophora sp. CBMAI 1063]